MRAASLDLCLELRSLAGWPAADDDLVWAGYGESHEVWMKRELITFNGKINPNVQLTPAYNADYLLQMLAPVTTVKMRLNKGKFIATAPDHFRCEGETMADALCKLAISVVNSLHATE